MGPKTIVVGIGNPLRADDSVGLWVARALRKRLNNDRVTVVEASVGGMDLVELLAGYDRAVLIDAIQTEGGTAGQVYRTSAGALPSGGRAAVSHTLDLSSALELGRKLGLPLPSEVIVFAIEAADMESFSERCTPAVAQAVPVCVEMVIEELGTS